MAIGGAGLVTFAVTVLGLNVAFGGSEGAAPTPQALAECQSAECLAPSALPNGTPSVQPTESKVAVSSKSPSASPSAKPSAASPRSSAPQRPSRDRPTPGSPFIAPPGPGRSPVTVRYSESDGWWESRGSYTLTNHGGTLRSWRLTFELDRGRLLDLWPLPYRRHGETIVVEGGALGSGASTTVTFRSSGRSTRPSDCTLNGSPCVYG